MEVSGEFQAPTSLSLGKEPLVPIEQEDGCTLEQPWTMEQTRILGPAGDQPLVFHPAISHFTD